MAASTLAIPEERIFRIFISYASKDLAITTAVADCFKAALPEFFAEVNFDRKFLEPGLAFQAQIEAKLEQANVLIIVYTGAEKQSHGYTGWEVGYYDRIMRTDPGRRKKISLYLYGPPATTAFEEGIPLGFSTEQLQLTLQEFESRLNVSDDEPLCKEIENWQNQVAANIEKSGLPRPHWRSEQHPETCVRGLKLAIFTYLKGIIEREVKPQRQITIRVKGSALKQSAESLPPEAEITPLGAQNKGGSMDIFGLSDEPITWQEFQERTASKAFSDSWRDAITRVVLSAFPDRVDVDNSQVILTSNGKTTYRVILTTARKFYDDSREYNVYFVETLRRADYGDQATTDLLKGLELVCRFRSMFLEPASDFLGDNIRLTNFDRLPEIANILLKELDLVHRDAQEAGLDKPGKWAKYVNVEHIRAVTDAYRPCELKLREIIPKINAARDLPAQLEPLREEMALELTKMEKIVRPENALLLREMVEEMRKIVKQQDEDSAARYSSSSDQASILRACQT